MRVFRLDASARLEGSLTRTLADRLQDRLQQTGAVEVLRRDLAQNPAGLVSQDWIYANFTPADARTPEQSARLAESDALVDELQQADMLVLAVPIYNFGVPAAFKAWIDQVARVGLTFRYTANGPEGLLKGKRAFVLLASGGTPLGSAMDFASPYIKHVLGFMGVQDVTVVAADGSNSDPDKLPNALTQIDELALTPKK